MESIQEQIGPHIVVMKKEEFDIVCQEAARIGANAAMEKLEKERRKEGKKWIDKRLHNTKLLLKNYHLLKMSVGNAIYSKRQMNESAADILCNVMNMRDDEVIIDSIKQSTARTAVIVAHIDKMLGLYKIYCQSSGKEQERRRYDIIFKYYVSENKVSIGQIARDMGLVRQTVYNDINAAEKALSALLFGIDSLNID